MPRFTTHHVIRDQYDDAEAYDLGAAIGSHLPCDIHVCDCKRLRNYTFGVACGCYRLSLQLQPGETVCCACGILELTQDDRFAAYALAWRRTADWKIGDRGEDAEPLPFVEPLDAAPTVPVTHMATLAESWEME